MQVDNNLELSIYVKHCLGKSLSSVELEKVLNLFVLKKIFMTCIQPVSIMLFHHGAIVLNMTNH